MIYLFLAFLFGSCFGSFVLVVVDRLHVAPIIRGKSKCLSCGKHLTWREMFPLFSYVLQRGKCSSCGVSYGVQHFLVEFMYGFLFLIFYATFLVDTAISFSTILWVLYYVVLFVVLGVLFLYDLRHKLIPRGYLFAFIVLSAIMLMVRFYSNHDAHEFFAPFVISVPAYLLYLLTKKRGLGLGDVLLFIGVPMLLGVDGGIVAMLLAIWAGALTGIVLLFLGEKYRNKYEMPLAPFIVLATLFVLFTNTSLWMLLQLFS